jgi:cytoplasmic iron level regulating protein YaaA (DUF328/UPF0246 family)
MPARHEANHDGDRSSLPRPAQRPSPGWCRLPRAYADRVLVLLPPSETKRDGGSGPPLSLAALSHPELDKVRTELLDELVGLAADLPTARAALGLTPGQDAEIARNAVLRAAPTMPALQRYSGVLYDALDFGSLRGTAAARARARLAVGSALFGLVHADDPIPAYRLSASAKLPAGGTLAARWRPALEPVLAAVAAGELVVDLRSGSYAGLGRVPGAVTVDVLAELPDGSRKVISHFNKAHKGRFARLLAGTRAEPADAGAVAALARRAGMRVLRPSATALELVIPAP